MQLWYSLRRMILLHETRNVAENTRPSSALSYIFPCHPLLCILKPYAWFSVCGSTSRTRSGLSCYANIMFDAFCIQNYAIRLDTSLVLVYWLGEHVWFHQIFICTVKMYETSSDMSKKLQDDSKMATTPLPPTIHFPWHKLLSKRTEHSDFPDPVGSWTHKTL